MNLIPAIDLRNNHCVRLYKGDFNQETQYSNDAVSVAKNWQDQGAKRLHIVDLDGAVQGKSIHLPLVKKIVQSVNIPVQLGGGLREQKQFEEYFDIGISELIVGTKSLLDRDFIKNIIEQFPNKIIIGVDTLKGQPTMNGWLKKSQITLEILLEYFNRLDIDGYIFTDIDKDGTLEGPNLQAIKNFCALTDKTVIASGGVSNINDVIALKNLNLSQIKGVISGKALYDGKLNLTQMLGI